MIRVWGAKLLGSILEVKQLVVVGVGGGGGGECFGGKMSFCCQGYD